MPAVVDDTEEMLLDTFSRFFGGSDSGHQMSVDAAGQWTRFVELGGHRIARGVDSEVGESCMLPALVARAAGRGVAVAPYLEHVHAFALLAGLGADDRSFSDDGTAWTVVAGPDDAAPRLVQGGAVAGALVSVDGTEVRLYSLEGHTPSPEPNLGALPMARIGFRASTPLASFVAAPEVVREARADRDLVEAAWLLGAGEAALDLVVRHVRERHQFDRPIGSFQALQHRLADCVSQLDGALLLLDRVARLHWGDPRRVRLAATTVLYAAATAETIARETVQMFGGYGVCDEYAAPHFLRRIKARKVVALDGFHPEDCLPTAGDVS